MRPKRRGTVVAMKLNDGAAFQALLQERGMSQKQFAVSAQVSEGFISQLIKGDRGCKAATAIKMLVALGEPWLRVNDVFDTKIHPAAATTAGPATTAALPESA